MDQNKPIKSVGPGYLGTHKVDQPNKPPQSEPQTALSLFQDEFKKHKNQIAVYLNGDQEKTKKFMLSAIHVVNKNPALLECNRASLLYSLFTCAELELYPSNISGEAYIVPYKGKAEFQLGYQGAVTLAYRSGVENIEAHIVYEKDKFEYEAGLNSNIIHKPDTFNPEGRGEPIGVYAIAVVNGRKIFHVMSRADIMKFREFSKGKASQYSPWNQSNDPEMWMWKKTCIKQLAKLLPKNSAFKKAIEKDNEESVIAERNNALNASGPAVGTAEHRPSEINQEENQNGKQDNPATN